jgi:hypothetical protein
MVRKLGQEHEWPSASLQPCNDIDRKQFASVIAHRAMACLPACLQPIVDGPLKELRFGIVARQDGGGFL